MYEAEDTVEMLPDMVDECKVEFDSTMSQPAGFRHGTVELDLALVHRIRQHFNSYLPPRTWSFFGSGFEQYTSAVKVWRVDGEHLICVVDKTLEEGPGWTFRSKNSVG